MEEPVEEQPALIRVSEICMELPETVRETYGKHATFRVKKKAFLYFLDDHHGDGIVGISVKLPPGENVALIAAQPERFYMPAYVGPRGWIGLRLDRGRISWNEVRELARQSYSGVAGPRLAAQIGPR